MKSLYPEITPFHTFYLQTAVEHQVYVEQCGNPAGIPVVFLHGGPCSGTKPDHRRFFNPARYHIILMDQRGCGKSLPFGALQHNTTQDLLADLQQLRSQLGISQWLLFGGSWGATLALLYAQHYPAQVSAMILRGTFLARATDMSWYLGGGLNRIYPQVWQQLLQSLPEAQRLQPAQALFDSVFSDDDNLVKTVTKQWQAWGGLTALGNEYVGNDNPVTSQDVLQARMELHYAKHQYFIGENQILQNCQLLQHIPTVIIHGQQDLTCPPDSAWLLHQALPQSQLIYLPNAGHVARGAEMIDALVNATDQMSAII